MPDPNLLSLRIVVTPLPSVWCTPIEALSLGLQSGRSEIVRGVAGEDRVVFEASVRVQRGRDGGPDFAGPLVHGRVGDRFLYLSWGQRGDNGGHEMFRRLKLYLSPVTRKDWSSPGVSWAQIRSGEPLESVVSGRGPDGTPSCGTAHAIWR